MAKENLSIHLLTLDISVNLNYCVSDRDAGAVVVVNEARKLRFTYTGHLTLLRTFYMRGVTIHNHSRILIADCWLSRVHIMIG